MKQDDQKEIALLIAQYLQGVLSPADEQQLMDWRNQSQRNEALFQKYLSPDYYRQMKSLYTPGEEDKVYRSLRNRLIPRRMKIVWGGVIWTSAAMLLLLFSWAAMRYLSSVETPTEAWQPQERIEQIEPGSRQAILYLADGQSQKLETSVPKVYVSGKTRVLMTDGIMEFALPKMKPEDTLPEGMNRIEVPRGGEYRLLLNDETHIYINSESEMHFPSFFSAEGAREIAFRGEAYFKVAHTVNDQPFIIHTDMGDVEVLGTSFNLRCYDESGILQLTLEEGCVRYTSPDGSQRVVLNPGEQLVYTQESHSLYTHCVNTQLYTSWKDGVYTLSQTPLEEIMENLSRWYNVPMVYGSEDLKQITFTGEVKRYANFGEVMQIFEMTKRIRFRMKGNAIHIVRE